MSHCTLMGIRLKDCILWPMGGQSIQPLGSSSPGGKTRGCTGASSGGSAPPVPPLPCSRRAFSYVGTEVCTAGDADGAAHEAAHLGLLVCVKTLGRLWSVVCFVKFPLRHQDMGWCNAMGAQTAYYYCLPITAGA